MPPPSLPAPPPETEAPPAVAGPPRVAVLLPLSGSSGALGKAMLSAAQMALFDVAGSQFRLMPRDTQGTPQAAAAAAQQAIADGARVIVGPLLAGEVEAVKPIAAAAHVPMLAFSTSTQLAGNGTYLLSFQPGQEIARVVAFAKAKGFDRFAVLAPRTPYGEIAVEALKSAADKAGATVARIDYYDPATTDLGPAVKRFSQNVNFNALLLPEGGARLRLLAPLLPYDGIDPDTIKFLGTGLWDEPGLGTEPALNTGWYAAPPPGARADFERRYRALFQQAPPRLATLAYDATALVATLSRTGDLSEAALTNPNGFAGLDGIFRLGPDGLIQRGLAVLEVRRGEAALIDPAPTSFQNLGQ
ncbi:MAG TPA: penicillin-binding protein activator [Stellaceae bacterium]|nr:penicillin-binding protein activator [Stellaceae bacterium]